MKTRLLILVLALQCAWLLGTALVQERALREGTVIRLETRPVDPRDLLRGDYVILNYRIGTIPTNLFSPPADHLTYGQTVWVALAPQGEFHEATRASVERFAPAEGEILVRGRIRWWSGMRDTGREVGAEYGLERYYVREGTGEPQGKLTVQAIVPASGRARLKQVFLDGVPYAEAMKGNAR
ncbi:MAG: GDYXXLXY domain-containing protein [Verrucomicrobiae bacterium]|nr:GDYXXLXY domain-containing protein [Verrucomicrobiae bacterium]